MLWLFGLTSTPGAYDATSPFAFVPHQITPTYTPLVSYTGPPAVAFSGCGRADVPFFRWHECFSPGERGSFYACPLFWRCADLETAVFPCLQAFKLFLVLLASFSPVPLMLSRPATFCPPPEPSLPHFGLVMCCTFFTPPPSRPPFSFSDVSRRFSHVCVIPTYM